MTELDLLREEMSELQDLIKDNEEFIATHPDDYAMRLSLTCLKARAKEIQERFA